MLSDYCHFERYHAKLTEIAEHFTGLRLQRTASVTFVLASFKD